MWSQTVAERTGRASAFGLSRGFPGRRRCLLSRCRHTQSCGKLSVYRATQQDKVYAPLLESGTECSRTKAHLQRMRRAFGFATVSLLGFIPVLAAADSPMAWQNVRRTGRSFGTSDIVDPIPAWHAFLGGRLPSLGLLVADVDKDGTNEIFLTEGGVSRRRMDGCLRWRAGALGMSSL